MRYYPDDKYSFEELASLNAEEWMVNALKLNPEYNGWGNGEDYMSEKDSGWNSPIQINSIDDLWELDDLNELVNFYFSINRKSKPCVRCDQVGYNDETTKIYNDWYDFKGTGARWCNNITQDEVDALWDNDRLRIDFKEKPLAAQVNKWSNSGIGHDAINRHICVKQRAKRLGVYGNCENCEGAGYIYTEDKAKLSLQMWMIHPRKGASRGVLLTNIEKEELPVAIEYLIKARDRNNERFSKLK